MCVRHRLHRDYHLGGHRLDCHMRHPGDLPHQRIVLVSTALGGLQVHHGLHRHAHMDQPDMDRLLLPVEPYVFFSSVGLLGGVVRTVCCVIGSGRKSD